MLPHYFVAVFDKLKWNDVKCLLLYLKFARKSVLVKTKPFNRQSYFNESSVQSAVHWHEHMLSALAAANQWPCKVV